MVERDGDAWSKLGLTDTFFCSVIVTMTIAKSILGSGIEGDTL
ncbi:hypothetical protein [Oceanobacillus jeddahense]|nr:hypothetical protein [Oceanobacillus jeddahense]